ncbi:GNAT family N-acetyltransferase [Clostridium argentinense]|nr:GNAT family N-acetyltransferase [Clostridium argentinense]NFP49795.1 GNAT family N-acetyltransferase [Clostridium argentinense]NFP72196.1 GNAT family N-acetyltransferase [Clostridium argentinense]NFP76897.1 GNAT family N-acetyltransferase [Clostridium argentinense]
MEEMNLIIKLNESHNEKLEEFLNKNKEINVCIIGCLERFGFDDRLQEIWAEFDEDYNYIAILLRHNTQFYFHSVIEDYDAKGFCEIINDYKEKEQIWGELISITKLLSILTYDKVKFNQFAYLDNLLLIKENTSVIKANLEDAEEIYSLRKTIEEFNDFKTSPASIKAAINSGFGRVYCIKENNKIVASAATTAESKELAMIVSVMTHNNHRNNGYAMSCVYKICKDLIDEGRTPCLFYDNPKAKNIYKNLGFEDIAVWVIVNF